ncbi:MAG: Ribosomal RNA large subunit methyltransferase M [Glaciecola sp. HTCC2999]|jgi:23S rRNA (cytidine2498-2'-O)-methyltransferase|nr:MAG: Ribosomal RNA large subunit methyltransferase M [Glaciecola sp. HTCC2999]
MTVSSTPQNNTPTNLSLSGLLCYCRSGYEANLAQELDAICALHQIFGFAKVLPNTGFVYFAFYSPETTDRINEAVRFDDLIFARQLIGVFAHIPDLDRSNRLTQIHAVCTTLLPEGFRAQTAVVESADTEDGKELAKFCRKFSVPFRQHLRAQDWLIQRKTKQALVGVTLHAFFEHGSSIHLGISLPNNRSAHENGIYRLKFPSDAPSRSTLKLEEAIHTFIPKSEHQYYFNDDVNAVDLGACPGGWTYQLVQRGVHVEAIDNGAMDDALMKTGRVDYFAADGFKYQPQYGSVNWLVCDMIEQPDRVAQLMTDWLVNGWAHHAIFNLKLPMKQRYVAMCQAKASITTQLTSANIKFTWQAKHLYHNRDEVTVCILRTS